MLSLLFDEMKDLWIGFDEDVFNQLTNGSDVNGKKRLLSGMIKENDVEQSHQRDLILDQLFSTLVFTMEMGFDYSMTGSIFELVVDEFGMLMEEEYDYGAEARLRSWIAANVKMGLTADSAGKLKQIASFVSRTMFGELETYHYALTHLPAMASKRVPIFVDTPLKHLPPLEQVEHDEYIANQ